MRLAGIPCHSFCPVRAFALSLAHVRSRKQPLCSLSRHVCMDSLMLPSSCIRWWTIKCTQWCRKALALMTGRGYGQTVAYCMALLICILILLVLLVMINVKRWIIYPHEDFAFSFVLHIIFYSHLILFLKWVMFSSQVMIEYWGPLVSVFISDQRICYLFHSATQGTISITPKASKLKIDV